MHKLGFGHVQVIWHNWAKNTPNMGIAAQQPGTGGCLESMTTSEVWLWALVCWSTAKIKARIPRKKLSYGKDDEVRMVRIS